MLIPKDEPRPLTFGQKLLIAAIALLFLAFLGELAGCDGGAALEPVCPAGTEWSPCNAPDGAALCWPGNLGPTTPPAVDVRVTACLTTSGLACLAACSAP